MTRKFIGVLAMMALLIGMLVVPATAQGQSGQCDGSTTAELKFDREDGDVQTGTFEGYELTATFSEDGYTVTFSGDGLTSVQFCVFGGGDNTESISGTSFTSGLTNEGDQTAQISNVVIYDVTYEIPEPVLDVTVRPILECVAPGAEGGYVAYFGYLNQSTLDDEPTSVDIAIGDSNKFTPGVQDRGQPTTFAPGRTGFVDDGGVFKPENAAVAVSFDGSNLVWTLDGRTSTASSSSTACPEPPETQTLTITKVWAGDELTTDNTEDVVTVTFNVLIEGEPVVLGDGVESEPFAVGEYEYVGENVVGFPDDVCSYESEVTGGEGGIYTVTNTVECEEEDEEIPPTLTLTVNKTWEGSAEDLEGATATLLIDGDEVDFGTAVEVEAGDTVTLSETVEGLDEDLCEWAGNLPETFDVPTDATVDTNYTIDVINVVACGEDGEDTTTVVEVEVPGETVVVEREVVRTTPSTTTETRLIPTRVESGTGGYLPNTGIPAFVLFLMGAGALLLGGGVLSAVRSRS